MRCRFMQVTEKFGFSKQQLKTFLSSQETIKEGTIKNLVNSLWNDIQPKRQLDLLAAFLAEFVPYDISAEEFGRYLRSVDDPTSPHSYLGTVKRIEGLYIQLRRHSASRREIVEYLTLLNGRIGYAERIPGAVSQYFEGTFQVFGSHLYAVANKDKPYSQVQGIAEIRPNRENPYPAQIQGVDDNAGAMVFCTTLLAKISNRISSAGEAMNRSPRDLEENDKEVRRFFQRQIDKADLKVMIFSSENLVKLK